MTDDNLPCGNPDCCFKDRGTLCIDCRIDCRTGIKPILDPELNKKLETDRYD